MQLVINKHLRSEKDVRNHYLFGKAIFAECGYHNPEKYCYDHHCMGNGHMSTCGEFHIEILQQRGFPNILVQQHINHFDNIMVIVLFFFRKFANTPDATLFVATANILDVVGPLALGSVDQNTRAVLEASRITIPLDYNKFSNQELEEIGLKAASVIYNKYADVILIPQYKMIYESEDIKFCIVESDEPIGSALYDAGYVAYAVYNKLNEQRHLVSMFKGSEYIPFNIIKAYNDLNKLEGLDSAGSNCWNGHSTRGGSPKPNGTLLKPAQFVDIIKKHYLTGWNRS